MSRKPRGYWQDEDNILAEANQMMETHGYEELPSAKCFETLGYSGLQSAIIKYYPGKLRGLRRDLGGVTNRKPDGYWQNPNNVVAEARRVMETHDLEDFPSFTRLRELGYAGLSSAITTHYPGSIRALRKDLGGTNSSKPPGYWQKLDNIVAEAEQVMEQHDFDQLPSQDKLRELGYSSLRSAINNYYPGGIRALRCDLGGTNSSKPPGYWQDTNNILLEAERVVEKYHYDQLPSENKLRDLGYSGLSTAISSYYPGSIRGLRRDLVERSTPGLSHVQSLAQQSPELAQIVNELYPASQTSVPSVGEAITPIDLPAVGSWYEAVVGKKDVDEDTLVRIDEVLYGLLQTEYQIKYNEDPSATLEELTQLQHEQPALNNITTKLVNYFTSVDEFDIPGF